MLIYYIPTKYHTGTETSKLAYLAGSSIALAGIKQEKRLHISVSGITTINCLGMFEHCKQNLVSLTAVC